MFAAVLICSLALPYNWDFKEGYEFLLRNTRIEWSTENPILQNGEQKTGELEGVRTCMGWKVDEDFTNCLQRVVESSADKKLTYVRYDVPFYGIELETDLQNEFHKAFKADNPEAYDRLMARKGEGFVAMWIHGDGFRVHKDIEEALWQSKRMARIRNALARHGLSSFRYGFEKVVLEKPQNLFRIALTLSATSTDSAIEGK